MKTLEQSTSKAANHWPACITTKMPRVRTKTLNVTAEHGHPNITQTFLKTLESFHKRFSLEPVGYKITSPETKRTEKCFTRSQFHGLSAANDICNV